MPRKPKTLTPREAELMSHLWDHGELTVREALELYPERTPYTSILAIFQTLREKGKVGYRKDDVDKRRFVHFPLTTRDEELWNALEEIDTNYCSAEGQLREIALAYLGET